MAGMGHEGLQNRIDIAKGGLESAYWRQKSKEIIESLRAFEILTDIIGLPGNIAEKTLLGMSRLDNSESWIEVEDDLMNSGAFNQIVEIGLAHITATMGFEKFVRQNEGQ